jgi:uncharacterized protein
VNDLEILRELVIAASTALERSRQRIDDLNVYPVPDGDTGTNLALTVRGIVEALDQSRAKSRRELANELSRAALMSARGNSGVILSQIVRGAAEVLGEGSTGDTQVVVRAFRGAADEAYRGVRTPVEGTMLTVIRELAEEAEAARAETPAELLVQLVRRGEEAVARTPEQLDVLREAGVVDAGGAGLLELLRGLAAAASGEILPEAPAAEPLAVEAVHREPSRYRYCTLFVIDGERLDASSVEDELEPLGDSLLVVGDASALKVHVHTDDPGAAITVGTRSGAIAGVEIADMHRQTARREERLLEALPGGAVGSAVVAVAPGDGNRRLFESLGVAKVVSGGQTMNPSTADLLAAVDAVGAAEVVVLPNNANVVMAAEQAARLAGGKVEVVVTDSIQAGLAAAVAFNPERSAEENAAAMRQAVQPLVTAEIVVASRDATLDGVTVHRGDFLARLEGTAVAAGPSFQEVARVLLERLAGQRHELLTVLSGENAPSLDRLLDELAERHPELEVEVHEGGQPHYPLLLSAE